MSLPVRKANMIFILTIKHLINLQFFVHLQCFNILMAAVQAFFLFFLRGGVIVVSMWRMAAAMAALESAG